MTETYIKRLKEKQSELGDLAQAQASDVQDAREKLAEAEALFLVTEAMLGAINAVLNKSQNS